jgi:hypothetical protein
MAFILPSTASLTDSRKYGCSVQKQMMYLNMIDVNHEVAKFHVGKVFSEVFFLDLT